MATSKPKIWWSNISFFLGTHLGALIGAYYFPIHALPRPTIWLAFASWQLSCFGITIGYHRLYTHKSFRASLGLRIILAALGTAAHQGSIRLRCLRHRLHHRFTDDPLHDPYAATRGLLFSHVGWIFFKPIYGRLNVIETDDLDKDLVVRVQHRYYHLLAVLLGFVLPATVGCLWRDATGGFIWGGLVARVLVWHCTFLVNSLAHWNGLQLYTDENTSRGNLHAFPYDFRSSPCFMDWDPSKWAILAFQYFGFATNLRRAKCEDIKAGQEHMLLKYWGVLPPAEPDKTPDWTLEQVEQHIHQNDGCCLILLDGYVLDVTSYLVEHPGGSKVIRDYALRTTREAIDSWPDASVAFHGGVNIHTWAANQHMKRLRLAKLAG
ncbi:hypothetical protein AGABI2DRAFT_196994 [Agaricus bisporus var. bisporus H97]|uniref:hypothetical protein n=1 Tax=Agaricus bisporus var. bisporus (strain H97 / ATCC MYA-4626 / FGSC 10389) TaxID=936046 RepID=UPI00029F52AB|nr:hypothetical protein AGABI2DRAFT_196994 [Agaricus bisporus var. bisporus H97]EKV51181.1 hypothetical protein AGABI2DRAFT_196994 [Agaricus bisporus var. bisporus H97]